MKQSDGTWGLPKPSEQNLEPEESITPVVLRNIGPDSLEEVLDLCKENKWILSDSLYMMLAGIKLGDKLSTAQEAKKGTKPLGNLGQASNCQNPLSFTRAAGYLVLCILVLVALLLLLYRVDLITDGSLHTILDVATLLGIALAGLGTFIGPWHNNRDSQAQGNSEKKEPKMKEQ